MHIIPQLDLSGQTEDWQSEFNHLITSGHQLLEAVGLGSNTALLEQAAQAEKLFPVRAPWPLVRKIKPGDANDPILKQLLASGPELLDVAGYVADPLEETAATQTPGLIHKYHGRVLLTFASQCVTNCRYCFRRHFDYESNRLNQQKLRQISEYLASDTSIKEIILSGGDPLSVGNGQFQRFFDALEKVEHIDKVRIHTRVPAVIPARIDKEFVNILARSKHKIVVVVHVNHAQELDEHFDFAMQQLRQQGVTLLNQSVLLKGVNDSADALINLSERLFTAGVLPYYLHLLDQVSGAAHFYVSQKLATNLHKQMQSKLPGYLVPRLVREIAQEKSKTWIL